MHRHILSVVICSTMVCSRAAHIVGGDLYYECLGNNNYKITLKIYRDCAATGDSVAWFDEPAFIAIYNNNHLLDYDSVDLIAYPAIIPPDTRNPCLQAPANICVEAGIFQYIKNLPPRAGGYDIAYVRCCRNATIQNIYAPNTVGATYVAHIPDATLASCNSSPVFASFPPIVICVNAPINFDHRAVDPDGDRLVYSLCTPYSGASQFDPKPLPSATLTPLGSVTWLSPFSATNPLGGSPPLTINPQTGFLTGIPDRAGQYVVGVCVSEYRNGMLLGETRRDFQFNIVQCSQDVRAIVPVVDTFGAAATSTAGVFIYQCQGLFVQLINHSMNGTYYYWDFGDPTTAADTSRLFQPFYTYPDSGVYRVQLIVNPGYTCADTTAVLVRIYPTFVADFVFAAGCANQPVVYTDRSSTTYGTINTWLWDFGDGIVSTDQHTAHRYREGGNYAVTLYATNTKGCSDSQTKTVNVHPMPHAAFSFTPACISTPVTFADNTTILSGGISSRTWLFNNSPISSLAMFTQTFGNLQTFQLTLIVTSDFGCEDTVTEFITVHPLPVAVVRADTAICMGESVTLHASGGIAYQWQPSAGLNASTVPHPVATPAVTMQYRVTVTDSNLCTDDDTVVITVNPLPETNAGADTYICKGTVYQLRGSGGDIFLWSPGNLVSDSTLPNPTISPSDTVTFILTSFNMFGCSKRDSVTIAVQHPISMMVSDDQNLCEGNSVTLSARGGLYYSWSPAGGLPDVYGRDYTVSPGISTQYSVIVSNDCFADTGYIQITVRPLPEVYAGVDDTMARDEFVMLRGTATGVSNFWEPSEGLDSPHSPVTGASPFNTTTYVLTSETEYGCRASDEVTIHVTVVNLIAVPTAFSPNQDGKNDVFRIVRMLNVERIYFFKIFNRWGNVVFETDEMDKGWNGTVYGEPQETGVYAYIIKALNRDGEIIVKEGTVTLVR